MTAVRSHPRSKDMFHITYISSDLTLNKRGIASNKDDKLYTTFVYLVHVIVDFIEVRHVSFMYTEKDKQHTLIYPLAFDNMHACRSYLILSVEAYCVCRTTMLLTNR